MQPPSASCWTKYVRGIQHLVIETCIDGDLVSVNATRCNTLQHTATHCNILQHTATYCSTLQRTATHCNALQRAATHCNALQCTTLHWFALRCTAIHCNTMQHTAKHSNTLQHTAPHCNTLQHTATHCNTQQHTAPHSTHASTHCNTLQHTATHCNTLQPSSICGTLFRVALLQMSHGTHVNESWHMWMSHDTCEWVMKHMWMSHDTCEWVMTHVNPAILASVISQVTEDIRLTQSQVSFAKEPYKRDNILQKRPIILRSLLIVATPWVTEDIRLTKFGSPDWTVILSTLLRDEDFRLLPWKLVWDFADSRETLFES